ncbi:aspartyl/asparaginyl beta-hydroxylase [Novosphingobium nitrogenifigens DSM 19370]|uniref:Aspartyl/asparaginyl beta-hydroxylase n=1 Tax=Novosphingobium nitrogenifigens DSM 19370 TaxID=983920 RepID=F1ZC49_9SPHN|nr:aspartyl/asparaginyl beta-hydroxylase domain-containing protein [Novosphingobium nitrogenifigens]EGD57814.1 aspartyl/asparaginyl beta-hydroxylase [Novosphingobium nitrogenifigens DSM 19370]
MAVRIGSKLRPAINWAAARASQVPLSPVIDDSQLEWTARLRHAWKDIAAEAESVLAMRERLPRLRDVSPDHKRIAGDGRWRCFFLQGYGQKIEANRRLAPRTASLLDTIPNLNSGFFSVLEPGAVIPMHVGVTRGLLTWHLGLHTPTDHRKCWIKVDNVTLDWQPGHSFLFDDTYPHEVHNDTDDYRVILLVQVERPMKAPLRWLPDLFLWGVKKTAFVRDARDAIERIESVTARMERA